MKMNTQNSAYGMINLTKIDNQIIQKHDSSFQRIENVKFGNLHS